jgi:hypothetical protein
MLYRDSLKSEVTEEGCTDKINSWLRELLCRS